MIYDTFCEQIEREFADLSGSDGVTWASFQNFVYAMIVVLEKVVEDGVAAEKFLAADEEDLSDEHGFTDDERIPIFDSAGILGSFRDLLQSQIAIEDLDAIEDRVCKVFDGLDDRLNLFKDAALDGDVKEERITAVCEEPGVAVQEPVAAAAEEPVVAAQEPVPAVQEAATAPAPAPTSTPAPTPVPTPAPPSILKKARRVTKKKRRNPQPKRRKETRKVRWNLEEK